MLNSYLKLSIVAAAAWMSTHVPCAAHAAEWGSLKGRILLDGTPAKPAPLVVNKDQFCIDKKPVNESIVVGKDNSLVNTFVYLRLPTGQKIESHPDYEAQLKEPVILDNNGCDFKPHAVTVRVGQPLKIKNSDPVGHNTNVSVFSFNQIIPANSDLTIKANVEGSLPQDVVCNIHGWMKGKILCQSHPYMSVSGEDGTFEIKNIPAGSHEFQFWHEAAGYLKMLKLKGATTDNRGRAKLTIAAGKTLDLGDLKVKASSLK